MARVKIGEIIVHLSPSIRNAFRNAVDNVISDDGIDENELFREFVRTVGRSCNNWENVPDGMVDKDNY